MSATLTLGITLLAMAVSGGDAPTQVGNSSLPPNAIIVDEDYPGGDPSQVVMGPVEGGAEVPCEACGNTCPTCGNTCQTCGHGHLPCTWRCWWFSCCDMPQHMPYFPADHGYYYFRPYHYSHVLKQRDAVMQWGGDPRNPYSNEIFDRVYADLRADEQAGKEVEKTDETPPVPVPPVEELKEDPKLEPVVPSQKQAESKTIRRLGHFVR